MDTSKKSSKKPPLSTSRLGVSMSGVQKRARARSAVDVKMSGKGINNMEDILSTLSNVAVPTRRSSRSVVKQGVGRESHAAIINILKEYNKNESPPSPKYQGYMEKPNPIKGVTFDKKTQNTQIPMRRRLRSLKDMRPQSGKRTTFKRLSDIHLKYKKNFIKHKKTRFTKLKTAHTEYIKKLKINRLILLKNIQKYDSSDMAYNLVNNANFPGDTRTTRELIEVFEKAIIKEKFNTIQKREFTAKIKLANAELKKSMDKIKKYDDTITQQKFYTNVFEVDVKNINDLVDNFKTQFFTALETDKFTKNKVSSDIIRNTKLARDLAKTTLRPNIRMAGRATKDLQIIDEFFAKDANKLIFLTEFINNMNPNNFAYNREDFIKSNNMLWIENPFTDFLKQYYTILDLGTLEDIKKANTLMDKMGKNVYKWCTELKTIYVKGEHILNEGKKKLENFNNVNENIKTTNEARSFAQTKAARDDGMVNENSVPPPSIDDIMELFAAF
jgi:hypothetical protein